MNFKKLLSLLMIFCMIFSFVACGDKDKDDDDNRSSKSSSQKDARDDDDDDDKDEKKDKKDKDDEDDKKDKDSKGDKKDKDDDVLAKYDEIDLPKNYPSDKFPIYKGGLVYSAIVDKSSGLETFIVSAVSKDDVEKVNAFYKGLIADAEDFSDFSMDEVYMYSGKYEGYEFTITCAPEDTNKDYALFNLMLKKLPSVESLLEQLNEGELPDDYPADHFPIIDGAAIINASESESNGVVSYNLNLYTDKSFKEILAFYEEAIGEITDKSKSSSTDSFELGGEAHGYDFDISGRKTERDGIDLVEYWIYLYPLSE